MKVLQVVSTLAMESSGPSYSVPALCAGLQQNGVDVELHTRAPLPDRSFKFPIKTYSSPRWLAVIEGSPSMTAGLVEAGRKAEIIHSNGLWAMPNVYPARAIRVLSVCQKHSSSKRPFLVTSPRGTFSDWALTHHAWKKRLFGFFAGQYEALSMTDMWHATSDKEYEEIRAQGYRQPVAVVPIGMDIPTVTHPPSQFDKASSPTRTLAFFGRIHPVKSIDTLLLAWHSVASRFPDWQVVIAGPDCGDRPRLENIIAGRRIPRVRFIGELNGQAKYDFLAGADLYCLPSKTENFGVTLAEALACGVPSLASAGTPWQVIREYGCGAWGFRTPDELAGELACWMARDVAACQAAGDRGRRLIRERFAWPAIGRQMLSAYEWLVHGGENPDCVRCD